MKKIFYNSITVNMPKNVFQLLFGSILFFVVFGYADIFKVVLAAAGLAIGYSSVYMYNDITDWKEDVMEPEKRAWKPIANGSINHGQARTLHAALLVAGLGISLFVNALFAGMVAALVVLNFLHSSPRTRFKKRKYMTLANMTAIEFIKYSSGWFALTSSLSMFPWMFVLMFAVVYTIGYMAYKFRFHGNIIRSNKGLFGALCGLVVALYLGSIIAYSFPLSIILMLLLSAAVMAVRHAFWRGDKRFNGLLVTEFVLLPLIIVSFLVLALPPVAELNMAMTSIIGSVF